MAARRILIAMLLALLLAAPAAAHSGGTDAQGGHYVGGTSEYHYHHGYPAHQHPDGVCPYDFDDRTGERSGSSGSSTSSGSSRSAASSSELTHRDKYALRAVGVAGAIGVAAVVAAVKKSKRRDTMFEPYGYKRLMSAVRDVLASVDKPGGCPPADEYIVAEIEKLLRSKMQEVCGWTESTNYEKMALMLVNNYSFIALSCGDYHLYRGVLDPHQCGPHMMALCEQCMARSVSKGYETEENATESLAALRDNISAAG